MDSVSNAKKEPKKVNKSLLMLDDHDELVGNGPNKTSFQENIEENIKQHRRTSGIHYDPIHIEKKKMMDYLSHMLKSLAHDNSSSRGSAFSNNSSSRRKLSVPFINPILLENQNSGYRKSSKVVNSSLFPSINILEDSSKRSLMQDKRQSSRGVVEKISQTTIKKPGWKIRNNLQEEMKYYQPGSCDQIRLENHTTKEKLDRNPIKLNDCLAQQSIHCHSLRPGSVEQDMILLDLMKKDAISNLSSKISDMKLKNHLEALSASKKESRKDISSIAHNLNYLNPRRKSSSLSNSDSDKEDDLISPNNSEDNRKIRKITKVLSDSISEEEILFDNNEEGEEKWLILPTSPFKIWWDFLLYIMTLYSLMVTPLLMAYCEKAQLGFVIIDFLMDCIFFVDCILHFFIPYYNFEENLVKSHRLIAINYLSSWFLWDFLACLPTSTISGVLDYINSESGDSPNKLITLNQTARFAKFYRVIRITQLFKVVKMANKEKRKHIPSLQFLNMSSLSSSLRRFFKFTVGFMLVSHILSCIWIFLGKSLDDCWIMAFHFLDCPPGELYIHALYYVWSTIFTIGYGDIAPKNTIERIFAVLLMFIGVLIYSFTLSSLGSILTRYDAFTENYMANVRVLNDIKRKYPIEDSFYDKLNKFLNNNYKMIKTDKFGFIHELPEKYRNQLLFAMYSDTIKNFKFMNYSNEDFIIKVLLSLNPIRVTNKEYVIVENEFLEEFFLVKGGILSINLPFKYNELKIMEIQRTEYFGDVLILSQYKSPVNVRVISRFVDLFTIRKNDLVDISLQFPDIFQNIFWKSTYNYLIMLELMEEKIKKFESENIKYMEFLHRLHACKCASCVSDYSATMKKSLNNRNYAAIQKLSQQQKELHNSPAEVQLQNAQSKCDESSHTARNIIDHSSKSIPDLKEHLKSEENSNMKLINLNFIIQNNNFHSQKTDQQTETVISIPQKENLDTSPLCKDESQEEISPLPCQYTEIPKKGNYLSQNLRKFKSTKVFHRSKYNTGLIAKLQHKKHFQRCKRRRRNNIISADKLIEIKDENDPGLILQKFQQMLNKDKDKDFSHRQTLSWSDKKCHSTISPTDAQFTKPKSYQERKGLTKAVIKNFNQQLIEDFETQKNPEDYFKQEFKSMLNNHFDEEVDGQLQKMVEVINPLMPKYNVNTNSFWSFISNSEEMGDIDILNKDLCEKSNIQK